MTAGTPEPGQLSDGEGGFVVWAALVANLGIAIAKFVAAAITGSSSMLSEAFHSVVDTSNEVLLLWGQHRSTKPADDVHPLGYGRELYFWSFVVAILIFAIGAGVSVYEGWSHIRHPEPIGDPLVNYIVLGVGFALEGASWVISLRSFNRQRGDVPILRAIKLSKDPPGFIVLLEDSAALLGLLVAAAGVGASVMTGNPVYDGAGSIVIGMILAVVAIVLARESKNLLIGERADPRLTEAIRDVMATKAEVAAVNDIATLHLAPDQIVAMLSVDFVNHVSAGDVERAILDAEREVKQRFPAVRHIYVTPREAAGENAASG